VEALELMGEETCVLHMVREDRSYTLEETGEILEVTRERVRQIEVMGLVKIKRNKDESEEVEKLREMMAP
jgi:DNA-directed RNA polymerase sigma subunit (sigma70/sigma32)